MFYNIKTQQILQECPESGYLEDGSWVQGLNLADSVTQISCGILPIISDTPTQPHGTIENISQRIININNNNTVQIIRQWIDPPVVIPETISARQIRLWLIDHNISLNSVKDAINTITDEKLREKTLVEWEYAPYIERNHPFVNNLGATLGLSAEQIDNAFIEAEQL